MRRRADIGTRAGEAGKVFCVVASEVTPLAGQTAKVTAEIARNVQQAARGTQDVSSKTGDINRAANETGAGSGAMLAASQDLPDQGELLRAEVAAFFSRARSA